MTSGHGPKHRDGSLHGVTRTPWKWVKTALALCILALFVPPPADAQQTRAQVTASVTIVEAVGVTVGARWRRRRRAGRWM